MSTTICFYVYYCLFLRLLLFVFTSTTVCFHVYYCLFLCLLLFVFTSTTVCFYVYYCLFLRLLLFVFTSTTVCFYVYYCLFLRLLLFVFTSTTVCFYVYYCLFLRLLLFVFTSTTVCFHSIDTMSELMRHAIEAKEKIKTQIILEQEDFLLDEVSSYFTLPLPPTAAYIFWGLFHAVIFTCHHLPSFIFGFFGCPFDNQY